ncbi:hypothetical protein BGZ58_010660 [Dissophora ornata]|nr:hypothetical protein BGZ58_010660 [Dissophora ornata]
MNDSDDLGERYHKLSQDYTRIKAQHTVLKRAVLKEQADNAAIQAALKEKEQEVRKSLQDLDLLSFHNQRLTKRIENLQAQASTKAGGSWLMGGGSVKKELEKSQTTLEAATIDLQAKIEENGKWVVGGKAQQRLMTHREKKLHQQLYEINALYPRHVTELQGKIQALEKQNQELQLDVERAGVANEDTIKLIRKEKDAVEKELGLIRDVLAGELKDEQRANQSLRDNVQRLEAEVERLTKVETALESLQTEHQKLQGELETFKWISSEFTELQKSYGNLERDKFQIEKAHTQLSRQHAALKQAEENVKRALVQEQHNLRAAQEQNQQLNMDLEAARGEAVMRERGHAGRIEQLEGELKKVRKEQEQLAAQYEELKVAEQSAKEGESRTKTDLAKELTKMKSSLESAESKVKELEGLKETLERELTETKKALEETMKLRDEQGKVSTDPTGIEKEDSAAEHDTKTDAEDGAHSEEDKTENDKAPRSKNARKKKKKAAAAAVAAAAVVVGAVAIEAVAAEAVAAEAPEPSKESADQNEGTKGSEDTISDSKDKEVTAAEKAKAIAEAEAAELKRKEEEKARKALEDSLRVEIDSLREQIKESQQISASKLKELSAAQAALETAKDEKVSLSSSLEMHVDLTIQMQQEIEDLKAELAKKQKSGANGAVARGASRAKRDNDEDEPLIRTRQKSDQGIKSGDHTPQRAATPVPTTEVGHKAEAGTVSKDASSQVDKIEASDKAVQSEKVQLVDEGTQADLEQNVSVAGAISSEATDVRGTKETKASSSTGRLTDDKLSRRSMIGDDSSTPALAASIGVTTTTTNQSNREYLIKQHYETKIQNVTEQLQLSDGRYARLHKEFEMLKQLLLETVQDKEAVAKECEQLKTRTLQLTEELGAAKEDCRAQVEMMTNYMKSLDQGQ